MGKAKPPPPFPRVFWPDPPPKPPRKAGKKASKPSPQATQSKARQQPPRAAEGSTRTQAIIPRLPLGLAPWTDGQIQGCESIAALERRAAALEDFLVDLGLGCWRVEDEQKLCLKRAKALRAEKRRAAKSARPRPRKPR